MSNMFDTVEIAAMAKLPFWNNNGDWSDPKVRELFPMVQALAYAEWRSMPKRERDRVKSIAGRMKAYPGTRTFAPIHAMIVQYRAVTKFVDSFRDPATADYMLRALCTIPMPVEALR